MEDVIKELYNAKNLQGETMVLSRFRLSEILSATENFSEKYCIGSHEYGTVYKAQLDDFDDKSSLALKEKNDCERPKTRISVAIKRISSCGDVKHRFFSEVEIHTSYNHPNIVSLIGFCDEDDEIILVFEHSCDKNLHDYLENVDNMGNLTWMQRLRMCLGIAGGLNHLHTKMDSEERIIHVDISSANILLGENLEPKIAYFAISKFHLANQTASTLTSTHFWDPDFEKTRWMKKESDVFSFGVTLFEIFCGGSSYDHVYVLQSEKEFTPIARSHFNDGTIKKLLDPKLKEVNYDDSFTSNRGPNEDSLDTFLKIVYQCLDEAQGQRPAMKTVIKELEMALNFQVAHEESKGGPKSSKFQLGTGSLASATNCQ